MQAFYLPFKLPSTSVGELMQAPEDETCEGTELSIHARDFTVFPMKKSYTFSLQNPSSSDFKVIEAKCTKPNKIISGLKPGKKYKVKVSKTLLFCLMLLVNFKLHRP